MLSKIGTDWYRECFENSIKVIKCYNKDTISKKGGLE